MTTKKEVTTMTIREIMAVDKAIQRVRDINLQSGSSIPGCTLPTGIMFLNAWTQNEIKSVVKGTGEAVDALREQFGNGKDENGKPKKWKKGQEEKFQKEVEAFFDRPSTIERSNLKMYSMVELGKLDTDDYLKKCNEKHPVPQEYFSLLMEAGLLEDDR